jgi:esterase/lipase
MFTWIAKRYAMAKIKAFIARKIVKRIQRKYNLSSQYKQSFTMAHDVDWQKINRYAELAKLAYADKIDDIKQAYPNQVYVNEIKQIRYFLLTNRGEKTYTISIRGTSNIKNAMQDIKFDKDWSTRLQCKVHSGFHGVAERIFADLRRLMADASYAINITGHSLGGAEAVIVGAYCYQAGLNVNEIITFGQPKVFDRDGIFKWEHLPLTRVVNETDVVPLVPPVELLYMFKRYRHFGKMIKLVNDEYYCFLEPAQASGMGVNSFWLNAAKEDFSFLDIAKELPDHFMDNYLDNITPKLSGGKEIRWKDRERYLEDET